MQTSNSTYVYCYLLFKPTYALIGKPFKSHYSVRQPIHLRVSLWLYLPKHLSPCRTEKTYDSLGPPHFALPPVQVIYFDKSYIFSVYYLANMFKLLRQRKQHVILSQLNVNNYTELVVKINIHCSYTNNHCNYVFYSFECLSCFESFP